MRAILRFLRDRSATTAIEYSLIGVIVSISLIAGARSIGSAMNTLFYTKALSGFS